MNQSRSSRAARRRGGQPLGRAAAVISAIAGCSAIGFGLPEPAAAHTDAKFLAPYGDYYIRWYQPHRVQPINNWDIEVTPIFNPSGRFVTNAQVIPDDTCWALDVPVNESAIVRVRSRLSTGQVSAWSLPTTVPEPGIAAGLTLGAGLLAALGRLGGRRGLRGRRTRTGDV